MVKLKIWFLIGGLLNFISCATASDFGVNNEGAFSTDVQELSQGIDIILLRVRRNNESDDAEVEKDDETIQSRKRKPKKQKPVVTKPIGVPVNNIAGTTVPGNVTIHNFPDAGLGNITTNVTAVITKPAPPKKKHKKRPPPPPRAPANATITPVVNATILPNYTSVRVVSSPITVPTKNASSVIPVYAAVPAPAKARKKKKRPPSAPVPTPAGPTNISSLNLANTSGLTRANISGTVPANIAVPPPARAKKKTKKHHPPSPVIAPLPSSNTTVPANISGPIPANKTVSPPAGAKRKTKKHHPPSPVPAPLLPMNTTVPANISILANTSSSVTTNVSSIIPSNIPARPKKGKKRRPPPVAPPNLTTPSNTSVANPPPVNARSLQLEGINTLLYNATTNGSNTSAPSITPPTKKKLKTTHIHTDTYIFTTYD